MNIFLKKFCLWIITCCSFCILCIPLVVVPSALYPYIFPKIIFFHVLVEIALLAWIPLLFLNKKYHPPLRHPIVIALSVFITLLVITALTGVDPYRSFFSTQERMTGVFTLIHLYAWFLMLISIFKTYKDWKKFILCTGGVTVVVALYGYVHQDSGTRSISTIGNAIFFGSYVLLHVFLIFFLLHREEYKKKYSALCFFVLICIIPSLFFSGSRMITLASLLGISLLTASYIFFNLSRIRKKIYVAFFCFVVIATGCIFFFNISSVGNTWAKKQLPYPIQRVFLFENYKKLQGARFEAWRIGLDGFKEKPLLGWGMENYPYIFQKYYRQPIVDEGENYADRSHNQYVDILALTGIIGFFSYVGFFTILFLFLIRISIKGKGTFVRLTGISLVILFLVCLLQNITSFDSPALLIVLYFSLALAYFFVSENNTEEKNCDTENTVWKSPRIMGIIQIVLAICLIFVAQKWSITPFIKNIQARVAFYAMKEQGLNEETLSYFKDSLDSDSFTNDEIRMVFAKSVYTLYMEKRASSKEFARQAVEYALAELDKSIQSRPLDVKNYFSQILLYRMMTPHDQGTLEKIEQRMERAYELAPYRPEIYREFPEIYIALKDFTKAESWLRKGADHFVPPRETHWRLAIVFLQKGDVESSILELAEAEKKGYPVFENPNMALLLSQKLLSGKKNQLALQYIDRMAQMYPDNKDVLNAQSEAHKKAE